ncbi:hypothetical protein MHBO_002311 [Bonamia ostreae]|uniref:Uncharacterized protein n=1 Tax=Bonamia ostreae TaxID=126728 RepID=A0ABV2AM02_9EUKA
MGIKVYRDEENLVLEKRGNQEILKSLEKIDMSNCTDSFMAMSMVAAVTNGTTEIFNIQVIYWDDYFCNNLI